jgi:murein DD-endopeptidase MepM/ murein hydrolase activator NlpD
LVLTPKGRCSFKVSHNQSGLHLKLAKEKQVLSAIPAIQPVRNENLKRMASGFGYRTDPLKPKMHEGMDYTKVGTPIFATGDGIVAQANIGLLVMGIISSKGYGYETLWAFEQIQCKAGQRVKQGDIIGYVGSTGRSEAPSFT